MQALKRRGCLLLTACASFLTGVFMIIVSPYAINFFIRQGLTLAPNTFAYNLWKENPMPLLMKFYMFNWTNPQDIRNMSIKPSFDPIGPFSFTEVKKKVNVTFNANDTVSFRVMRTYYFNEEESEYGLDEMITTINAVSLSASYQARNWGYWMRKMMQYTLNQVSPKLHVTKTAGEFLFDGYEDLFVTLGSKLPVDGPKYDKFGWFYTRNHSSEFDGYFNMGTDYEHFGELRRWNFDDHISYYKKPCSQYEGASAGELYVPGAQKTKIRFFSPDLCRGVPLDYVEEETIKGLKGYKYTAFNSMLENGTMLPDNLCFNNGDRIPSGMLNMSDCKFGTPGFVSLPHFYNADPYYINQVEGLEPDKEKHEFFIVLEPTTSIPLQVCARLQLNLLLQPIQYLTLFEKVPKVYFPVLWFEQCATLPDHLATAIHILLYVPLILEIIGLLALTGGLTLIIYIVYKPIIQLMQQKPLLYGEAHNNNNNSQNRALMKELKPLNAKQHQCELIKDDAFIVTT